jgi:hypothetical protein
MGESEEAVVFVRNRMKGIRYFEDGLLKGLSKIGNIRQRKKN